MKSACLILALLLSVTPARFAEGVLSPPPDLRTLPLRSRNTSFGEQFDAGTRKAVPAQTPGLNFASAVSYDVGIAGAWSVAVADVNGDGKPDLVVAGGTVGVLLGNGDGTFQPVITYDAGGQNPSAVGVVVVDLNGDGKLDLAVANANSDGTVGVLLGIGDGTFEPVVTYGSGGTGAKSLTVADVNGDGKPDLLVANPCTSATSNNICLVFGSVGVLLGNGDGTFLAASTYRSSSQNAEAEGVVVVDVNGDGQPDLLVANNCSDSTCQSEAGTVGILFGNGDGTLQTAVEYTTGGFYARSLALRDVNGDGKVDLVVANRCDASNCSSVNGTAGVLLGNGDGTF